jgi:hypothetical protein
MSQKSSNHNWASGRPNSLRRSTSNFTGEAERLGLTEAEYLASAELKSWCKRNRNQYYIPEWLLKEWGMEVDPA